LIGMILVVSYPGDEHTDRVVDLLHQAGHDTARLDLGDLPSRAAAEFRYNGGPPVIRVRTADGNVDLGGCRVAWWRRIRPFGVDASVTSPEDRAFVASETTQAVYGALSGLNCDWVNQPHLDEAAHRKPYQWSVAGQVGLSLPRTLVTNSPDRALEFVTSVGVGRTVFKAFLASTAAWRETRLVREDDLARIDSVRYAPVIFQEYVEGVDLRITVVDDVMYAAEIDATRTTYPVDMRMVVGEAMVRPVDLPPDVSAALRRLMRRLGLVYGAIDMRRRPDGTYVFFEVNPAGQWLFVEERTGQPISRAVADALTARDTGGSGASPAGTRAATPGSR
jgi:glutathione synthase/RimK-type ligase-like ATP-grasp enzyme